MTEVIVDFITITLYINKRVHFIICYLQI
jgi:hypothetical protein